MIKIVKEKTIRPRRSSGEAQRVILDAAEKRLVAYGPEGIRLLDIAKDIGISHPTILHHFESREGLVQALARRTVDRLRDDLLAAFSGQTALNADVHPILERVFDVLSNKGHARLIGWMILGGSFAQAPQDDLLRELTDLIHPMRVAECTAQNLPVPPREDTLFMVMLGAVTAFGDGLFGPLVLASAGVADDPKKPAQFHAWFAKLLRSRVLPNAS